MPTPNLKTFLINSIDEFPKGKFYYVIHEGQIIMASRDNSNRIEYQIVGSDDFWTVTNWIKFPLLCIDPGEILLDTDEDLAKDQDAWMSD